ncbi:hypothetical protein Tco_1377148 [Tanacetum coccineum]|uniref:Uncharacterized protein n=1 Tax=Tanacetum coccineum TaxID=301880 RepID=A0ABQ5I3U0_9ASTR
MRPTTLSPHMESGLYTLDVPCLKRLSRAPVPAILIPGCPALPCKVSSLMTVETLHLGLVNPNYFFVGHVQLPSSILHDISLL